MRMVTLPKTHCEVVEVNYPRRSLWSKLFGRTNAGCKTQCFPGRVTTSCLLNLNESDVETLSPCFRYSIEFGNITLHDVIFPKLVVGDNEVYPSHVTVRLKELPLNEGTVTNMDFTKHGR